MAWETKQNAGDSGRVVPLPGATLGPALSPYAFCGNIGCTRECPGRECIQIPLPLSSGRGICMHSRPDIPGCPLCCRKTHTETAPGPASLPARGQPGLNLLHSASSPTPSLHDDMWVFLFSRRQKSQPAKRESEGNLALQAVHGLPLLRIQDVQKFLRRLFLFSNSPFVNLLEGNRRFVDGLRIRSGSLKSFTSSSNAGFACCRIVWSCSRRSSANSFTFPNCESESPRSCCTTFNDSAGVAGSFGVCRTPRTERSKSTDPSEHFLQTSFLYRKDLLNKDALTGLTSHREKPCRSHAADGVKTGEVKDENLEAGVTYHTERCASDIPGGSTRKSPMAHLTKSPVTWLNALSPWWTPPSLGNDEANLCPTGCRTCTATSRLKVGMGSPKSK